MNQPPPLKPSAVEAIGDTPLVELSRLVASLDLDGRILAKLEYYAPGASKKDRIARHIIEEAETAGELTPGQTVVELTSGNTGTGLAVVCGVKGYPFVAVMSRGNSQERARMMRALGAEVVLVDQAPGSTVGQVSGEDLALVETEAQRLVAERSAFRADQHHRWANFRAHQERTGPEIWQQSNGHVTAFCDYVGTGGSLAGCADALKAQNPAVQCFAVEPEGAAVLKGEPVTRPGHRIQGGGYANPDLEFIDHDKIDGYVTVTDDDATDMARRLARTEGVFAGFSAGANAAAAAQLLQGPCKGGTVAILICDSGLKYLSTDLWP